MYTLQCLETSQRHFRFALVSTGDRRGNVWKVDHGLYLRNAASGPGASSVPSATSRYILLVNLGSCLRGFTCKEKLTHLRWFCLVLFSVGSSVTSTERSRERPACSHVAHVQPCAGILMLIQIQDTQAIV